MLKIIFIDSHVLLEMCEKLFWNFLNFLIGVVSSIPPCTNVITEKPTAVRK